MRTTISDDRLIQYLLGAPLLEEEESEIETLYLTDDEFLEHLQALELEVSARYLKNDLNLHERYLFENRFLLIPERRNSLDLLRQLFPEGAESLPTTFSPRREESVRTDAHSPAKPLSSWWRRSLLATLSSSRWPVQRGAFAGAAVSAVLIVGILSVWTFSRSARRATEVASVPPEVSPTQQIDQQPPDQNSNPAAATGNQSATANPPDQIAAADPSGNLSARQLFNLVRQRELDSPVGTRELTASVADRRTVSPGPPGIRYRIFIADSKGEVEVDPDQVFTSRDTLRFQVDVNSAGYLYIVAQESSGKWSVLFPSDAVNNGDNRVRPSDRYGLSATNNRHFMFSGPVGAEKFHIVFSRQPSKELDALVYPSDRGRQGAVAERLNGSEVTRVYRGLGPKDVVIEKVDERRAGVQEKAVYVVSRRNSETAGLLLI